MNFSVFCLNVFHDFMMVLADLVKFLSGPHSSRHDSDFSEVYVKSSSFSLKLQALGKRQRFSSQ